MNLKDNKITKIKAVAFDLDGTIYYGSKLIDGSNDAVIHARNLGLHVFFITNNSTKSRDDILQRLRNMGVECNLNEIYSSGYAAALYSKLNAISDIFISGSSGLIREFENLGVSVKNIIAAKNLVIGYDPEFNYKKLTEVLEVALKADKIIACNKERTYPGLNARIMPGCGAMVSAVEWCANRSSDYVIGKPNPFMINLILDKYKLQKDELLVVGDTYESDIEMAKLSGCPSVYLGQESYADTICIKSMKDINNIITEYVSGDFL